MQDKLAERAEPGRQIDSLKALYDLWVDAAEEAYAEIALTDEFREVYGEMVNTQMRVRQMQQRQTGQWCRELGLPTREEVSALGERLQQLRRDLRKPGGSEADTQILALRREVAALKRELAALGAKRATPAAPKPKPAASRVAAAKAKALARGKSPATPSKPRKR